jgi:hypothetical protein
VAPLPTKTQYTAGPKTGGLRVPDCLALFHAFRDAIRSAAIGGRPFRVCFG